MKCPGVLQESWGNIRTLAWKGCGFSYLHCNSIELEAHLHLWLRSLPLLPGQTIPPWARMLVDTSSLTCSTERTLLLPKPALNWKNPFSEQLYSQLTTEKTQTKVQAQSTISGLNPFTGFMFPSGWGTKSCMTISNHTWCVHFQPWVLASWIPICPSVFMSNVTASLGLA